MPKVKSSIAAAGRAAAGRVSRIRKARGDHEQGSSMVEFALCLPVMLLIVTGITSFGLAMNQYMMLTDANNSGARVLAISRGQTTDPCALAYTTVKGAASLMNSSNISFTLAVNGTTYTGQGSSFSCTSGAANLVQGATSTLTTTYPCILQVYGKNLFPSCSLMAQDAELVE